MLAWPSNFWMAASGTPRITRCLNAQALPFKWIPSDSVRLPWKEYRDGERHRANHSPGCGAGASNLAKEALSRSGDREPHHRPTRLPQARFDAEQGGAIRVVHLRARRPRLENYFLRASILGSVKAAPRFTLAEAVREILTALSL